MCTFIHVRIYANLSVYNVYKVDMAHTLLYNHCIMVSLYHFINVYYESESCINVQYTFINSYRRRLSESVH